MNDKIQKEVKKWLTHDRNFNTGIQLYFKYGNNKALMRAFNMSGETKNNVEALHEAFRKMIGANFEDFSKMMKKPVKTSAPAKKPETPKKTEKVDPPKEAEKKK